MSKKIYGLLGKNISYSFSKKYFTNKFKEANLDCTYKNFDLNSINELPEILDANIDYLKGFNVTIPYKETIFKYLDEINQVAEDIGAVNCVKIIDKYYLKGFNTDAYGFENSLKPLLKKHHKKALILGTGGASKAIAYALEKLEISFKFVSRNPKEKQISYADLSEEIIKSHHIIINTTPLGTKNNSESDYPNIPYEFITDEHLLFDLIYNPLETIFLKKGKEKGATVKNGLEMLELQAEKSWEIWNEVE
jgi:shikimate dehydrogenase